MTRPMQFSDKELELLVDVLESSYGSIREQAYKAEAPRFKDQLKQRERLLAELLERVRAEQAAGV